VIIEFTLNGKFVSSSSSPSARLLDVLRKEFSLTGCKEGCGEGECGACAVLIDGRLVNSCLLPLGQVIGCRVQTIEGISSESPLVRAFIRHGAAQCGICTPGMVLAATALLEKNKRPNLTEIQWALSGNLCRCTGYGAIYEAVMEASMEMQP